MIFNKVLKLTDFDNLRFTLHMDHNRIWGGMSYEECVTIWPLDLVSYF